MQRIQSSAYPATAYRLPLQQPVPFQSGEAEGADGADRLYASLPEVRPPRRSYLLRTSCTLCSRLILTDVLSQLKQPGRIPCPGCSLLVGCESLWRILHNLSLGHAILHFEFM